MSDKLFTYDDSEGRFIGSLTWMRDLILPLTVTLQITRRCNLKCVYCSECTMMPDSSLSSTKDIIDKLDGIERLIISGGEPTLSSDFATILEYCHERFPTIALATNATRIDDTSLTAIKRYVDYVDVTLDGPRLVHDAVRGGYDRTRIGLQRLVFEAKVPVSIVMVVMRQNARFVEDIVSVADFLGARKVKLLSPIAKGRGTAVLHDALTDDEIRDLHSRLGEAKVDRGWKCRISVTLWSQIGMGHALLVHPDGKVVASPVWSDSSGVQVVGNLQTQDMSEIWRQYEFKSNHLRKYLGTSMLTV